VLAYDPADETALTRHVSGGEYIGVLLARQAAYLAAHPPRRPGLLPLLEWFVRDEDEPWVMLPEAAPKPKPKPRQYRSAASIREELENVEALMAAVASNSDTPDRAAANLSPNARNQAAARAGRRRFERMDRDLERFAALQRRRDRLVSRLATAQAREKRNEAS
jgi:hypothetical protein